tara:strand:+ start:196 stop:612 length:417 start_codon:yes stop_codon:yes gene_type:complete
MKKMIPFVTTIFLILSLSSQSYAQEVLTRINGGASWRAPGSSMNISNLNTSNTSSHTLTDKDHIVFVDASNNDASIIIPDASTCPGKIYYFIKISSSNDLILFRDVQVNPKKVKRKFSGTHVCLSIVSDGTKWWEIDL